MSFKRFICLAGLLMASSLVYAEDAPESVKTLIPELKALGTNPVLVAAVKAQNAKGMTLDEIKKRDEQ